MNGGYCMIDCSGLDLLAGSKVTFAGLYGTLGKALKADKPIIAYGAEYNDVPSTPITLNAYQGTNKIIAKTGVYEIEVDKDDGVTVKDLTAADTRTTKKK